MWMSKQKMRKIDIPRKVPLQINVWLALSDGNIL
jgi:hypothetical protein